MVQALNGQLHRVSASEVQAIISSFPDDRQGYARAVLARASGFASIESLNALRLALEPHLQAGGRLYTSGKGSVSDALAYLARKKTFESVPGLAPGAIGTTVDLSPDSIVILDDVVLARLKSSPAFAQAVLDSNCVLLNPRGLVDGINMFNSPAPGAIKARVGSILDASLERMERTSTTFEAAVAVTLDARMNGVLGAVDSRLPTRVRSVEGVAHMPRGDDEIARQLNGDAGITPDDLEQVLSSFSEHQRRLARALLVQQTEIYSSRRLAADLKEQHEHVMKLASQRGIKAEDVYFVMPEHPLPDIFSSFDIVAMAHRQATGTPVHQYLCGPADLRAVMEPDDSARKMFVILDDFAGSGMTLRDAAAEVGRVSGNPVIVVAPLVARSMAAMGFDELSSIRPNVVYEPGRNLSGLYDSPFYTSLVPVEQSELKKVVGAGGWSNGATCIVFPYMAPDNNNAFFGDRIAEFFLVNRNRRASKMASR